MASFRRLIHLYFAFTIFICEKAFTQSQYVASHESQFSKLYSRLFSFIQIDYDSTTFYSEKFDKEFTNFIKSNPETLSYPFDKLVDSNFCQIKTSSDGNFRMYSWDTWTGGTMHFFKEIYQWKDNGKVFTKVPAYGRDEVGSFCSKIFTIDINNKPYYLTVTNSIYSTKDAMQSISAFAINDNELDDTAKVFKTKTKKLNRIDVKFDFFSVVDRPERPLELITYHDKQKILSIPLVDKRGNITKKNIFYQLKDRYFELIGFENQ